MKFNPLGQVVWLQKAEGLDQDTVADLAVTPNGDVIITGRYRYGIQFGSLVLPETGLYENYLARYHNKGSLLWARHFGMPQVEFGDFSNSVATDYAGNAYVTGNFSYCFQAGDKEYSGGASDVFLAKFDENGTVEWVRTGGGSGYDEGHKVLVDELGHPFVAGVISDLAKFDGKYTSASGLYSSKFLVKYNARGELLWLNGFGSDKSGDCKSSYVRPDGKCVLNGCFSGAVSTGTRVVSAFGLTDVFIAQMQFNTEIQIVSVNDGLNPICTGSPHQVQFMTSGSFGSDNVFSAALSDQSGDFTRPAIIGSGKGSPLPISIPDSTLPGNNYRMRIVSSAPYLIGYEYTRAFTISRPPDQPVVVAPNATSFCAGDSIQLMAPGIAGPTSQPDRVNM